MDEQGTRSRRKTDAAGPDESSYSLIHTAILFMDIENSVMLSATLRPLDYDQLLTQFQTAMHNLVQELKAEGFPIGEFAIAGDQLSIFFYDPDEVERNRLLDGPDPLEGEAREFVIARCREVNDELVYAALRASIIIKNTWLLQEFNQERVRHRREVLGIGVGFHYGQVYLFQRPDGQHRIEGFAVNLAKRIESYARHGKYSHIMLSQRAHDQLAGMVRAHTQVRQRIYFHRHDVDLELLKGVTESQVVYELKFYSRLKLHSRPEVAKVYEDLFFINTRNIWAYYQLSEHNAYVEQNWEAVLHAAQYALSTHPNDEKVLLDLSRYYFRQGNLRVARELAAEALQLNPVFDLAYEHLAAIASAEGKSGEVVELMLKSLRLAPLSPTSHMNLGMALCEVDEAETARYHIERAMQAYPHYPSDKRFQAAVEHLGNIGKRPAWLHADGVHE